eukprot:6214343-Pleurochrysis_carterae.AAC.1
MVHVEGDGRDMLVEEHVQMIAKADFDLVLHHGLLHGSQVDLQVGHKQRVGELDDCAGSRNNDGIALASVDDGRDTLLSGLDRHVGLGVTPNGNHCMSLNMCWSPLESMCGTTCPSSCAKPGGGAAGRSTL